MADTSREFYLSWLNDAYAMEKNVEEVLERHVKQAENYPEIQSKIQQHLDITRTQADRVQSCIERNGGDVSSLKSGIANMMGAVTGAGSSGAQDKLIKDAIADYATENFEIASYAALTVAAQSLGDQETAQICQDIIGEEHEMATWLAKNLSTVSQTVLQEAPVK
jgi:ferritin-like metal-binding protein YciE